MTVALLLLAAFAQSSLLIGVAASANWLLRRRAAALRHRIWSAAFLAVCLVPLAWALSPLAADTLIGGAMTALDARGLQIASPSGGEAGRLAGAMPQRAPFALIGPLDMALLIIWSAGVLALAARSAASYARAHGMEGSLVPDLQAAAPVYLSNALLAPATLGLLRSRIFLPVEARSWGCAELDAVLAHESAHVRRGDLMARVGAELACILFWFNPLLWGARAKMDAEAEFACDDEVLAAGVEPHFYAALLLGIAENGGGSEAPGTLAIVERSGIGSRIQAIVGENERGACGWRAHAAIAASALTLLSGASALRPAWASPWRALEGAASAAPQGGYADPRSELLPLDYDALAHRAGEVEAGERDAGAIALLKAELSRRPQAYDDLVRERSIWTLIQVDDGRLLEPLLARAHDRDWRVRAYVAWGLALTPSPSASEALQRFMSDPVWRVRANAAYTIVQTGEPAARPAMTRALDDDAWQVRHAAVQYFAADRSMRARLRTVLRSDPHAAVRAAAEEALSS